MRTRYYPKCTCTHRKCHRNHAPELLCRPALADLIVDHLDARGVAKEAGDTAKVAEEEATVAFLKEKLAKLPK